MKYAYETWPVLSSIQKKKKKEHFQFFSTFSSFLPLHVVPKNCKEYRSKLTDMLGETASAICKKKK